MIVLCLGGGGHSSYGFALLQRFYEIDKSVLDQIYIILPENDKLFYNKIVKTFNFPEERMFKLIKPREANEPISTYFKRVWNQRKQLNKIREIFKESKIFISTGSNFCILPSYYAKKHGLFIYNIESFCRIVTYGKACKLIDTLFANVTVLQCEEQLRHYKKKGKVYGFFYEKPMKNIEPSEDYVLVLTGTHGFNKLVDTVIELAHELENEKFIIQTSGYKPNTSIPSNVELIDYIYELDEYVPKAKLVISQTGKTILDIALGYRKPLYVVYNITWKQTATDRDWFEICKILDVHYVNPLNFMCSTLYEPDCIWKELKKNIKSWLIGYAYRILRPRIEKFEDGAHKLAFEILQKLKK